MAGTINPWTNINPVLFLVLMFLIYADINDPEKYTGSYICSLTGIKADSRNMSSFYFIIPFFMLKPLYISLLLPSSKM